LAVDADTEGCVLVQHVPSDERFVVHTTNWEDHVIAWTTLPAVMAKAGPCAERWQVSAASSDQNR
jgi:hypothetical protein